MRYSAAGFLVWLAPFVVSCFFIGPDGKKTIEDGLFKNIMISVGGFTSSVLIYRCEPKTAHEGLQMAVMWLAINWGLDLCVLVPLFAAQDFDALTLATWSASVPKWFLTIGMGYIAFVSPCVVAGACAERAAKQR